MTIATQNHRPGWRLVRNSLGDQVVEEDIRVPARSFSHDQLDLLAESVRAWMDDRREHLCCQFPDGTERVFRLNHLSAIRGWVVGGVDL